MDATALVALFRAAADVWSNLNVHAKMDLEFIKMEQWNIIAVTDGKHYFKMLIRFKVLFWLYL